MAKGLNKTGDFEDLLHNPELNRMADESAQMQPRFQEEEPTKEREQAL